MQVNRYLCENQEKQKLSTSQYLLKHTETAHGLVSRSRRSAHTWAQAFEFVQWVSQMGMLGFLGWICVNITVHKRCLLALPAFAITLNHQFKGWLMSWLHFSLQEVPCLQGQTNCVEYFFVFSFLSLSLPDYPLFPLCLLCTLQEGIYPLLADCQSQDTCNYFWTICLPH